ncbi:hypothetical protein Ciccas_014250 [Cichlidogyrus casuarinus]|uniref:Uncharacterized protein n=1 Tax=Cichlidogyrus casuarinus TaxID=1844966 RepID=A0ABD2PLF7_9PLAT
MNSRIWPGPPVSQRATLNKSPFQTTWHSLQRTIPIDATALHKVALPHLKNVNWQENRITQLQLLIGRPSCKSAGKRISSQRQSNVTKRMVLLHPLPLLQILLGFTCLAQNNIPIAGIRVNDASSNVARIYNNTEHPATQISLTPTQHVISLSNLSPHHSNQRKNLNPWRSDTRVQQQHVSSHQS